MVHTQNAWFHLDRKGEGMREENCPFVFLGFGFPFGFVTFADGKHGPAVEDCVSQLLLSHTHKHTMGPQPQDSSLVTWSHMCWCSSRWRHPPPARCGSQLRVWGGRCSPPAPAGTAGLCAGQFPSCHLWERQLSAPTWASAPAWQLHTY